MRADADQDSDDYEDDREFNQTEPGAGTTMPMGATGIRVWGLEVSGAGATMPMGDTGIRVWGLPVSGAGHSMPMIHTGISQ